MCELIDENEMPIPNREDHENNEGMKNLWLSFEEAQKRLTHNDSKEKLQEALKLLTF